MALKITKAADPITVDRLAIALYGPPGVGKSSLAFSADAPLLLDFDQGVHRSGNRGDSVKITAWADVDSISADDLADYKTVIVDTAGRALDMLSVKIMRDNPKLKGYGGALSLQGYGVLKASFTGWLSMLRQIGKDVILIAHSDEQRNGDEVIERLDVQGGSKNEIYKSVDAMGRIKVIEGKRVLTFSPTDTAFGKNPGQLEALPIPDFSKGDAKALRFMGDVIGSIKAKLNASSEAAQKEQARMLELRESFNGLETVDQFNAKLPELAKAEPKVKALLLSVAEAHGFTFDKKTKAFVVPAAKAA